MQSKIYNYTDRNIVINLVCFFFLCVFVSLIDCVCLFVCLFVCCCCFFLRQNRHNVAENLTLKFSNANLVQQRLGILGIKYW